MAVRRVRRVVRKIDPWTVLKVSFVFNVIASLVFVLGTWVMWSIIVQRGIPERLTELAETLTLSYTPDGELYFRIVVLLAVVWAIGMTGVMTLAAVLYNLISDVVGGLEVVVLEETLNVPAQAQSPARVRPATVKPAPQATTQAPAVKPEPAMSPQKQRVAAQRAQG